MRNKKKERRREFFTKRKVVYANVELFYFHRTQTQDKKTPRRLDLGCARPARKRKKLRSRNRTRIRIKSDKPNSNKFIVRSCCLLKFGPLPYLRFVCCKFARSWWGFSEVL